MKKIIISKYIFPVIGLMITILTGCVEDEMAYDPSKPFNIESFIPTEGGGGTEILINGSNFPTDISLLSLSLNGNPLSIVGANTTQIMAVVPKKAGSGPIVIDIEGNKAESEESFTYKFTRTVTTLAGNGTAGYQDGQGQDAMFNFNGEVWYRSMGITVDDDLNVYVADPGNHCIRKIDSLGNVITLVGNPNVAGYADGQGTSAHFSLPYDVALDKDGNLFVVDPGNWDVRKVSPDGVATTWAWGAQAPWSVAVDPTSGVVYYSSCSSPGNVYPVMAQWTTGDPIVTDLNYPAGIAFDKEGNLLLSSNGDQVIKKYTAGTWQETLIAGQQGSAGYENGSSTEAKFAYPWGLTVDEYGNVYVAGNGTWDGGSYNPDQSIRLIDTNKMAVSTFAGSGTAAYTNAIGSAAAFNAPTGVAVDKNGTVYVLDKNNNMIRKIVSE